MYNVLDLYVILLFILCKCVYFCIAVWAYLVTGTKSCDVKPFVCSFN